MVHGGSSSSRARLPGTAAALAAWQPPSGSGWRWRGRGTPSRSSVASIRPSCRRAHGCDSEISHGTSDGRPVARPGPTRTRMRISELLHPQAVLPALAPERKLDVLLLMASRLSACYPELDRDRLAAALLTRERLMCT